MNFFVFIVGDFVNIVLVITSFGFFFILGLFVFNKVFFLSGMEVFEVFFKNSGFLS